MPASIAGFASGPAARFRSMMSSAWRFAASAPSPCSISTIRWEVRPASPAANACRHAQRARGWRNPSVDDGFRHQRARGACLHAFAAGDAGRTSHRIVEIEHGLGADAAKRHADDIIDLNLAAGPDAKPAIDAGIEIDRHGGMGEIGLYNVVGG